MRKTLTIFALTACMLGMLGGAMTAEGWTPTADGPNLKMAVMTAAWDTRDTAANPLEPKLDLYMPNENSAHQGAWVHAMAEHPPGQPTATNSYSMTAMPTENDTGPPAPPDTINMGIEHDQLRHMRNRNNRDGPLDPSMTNYMNMSAGRTNSVHACDSDRGRTAGMETGPHQMRPCTN